MGSFLALGRPAPGVQVPDNRRGQRIQVQTWVGVADRRPRHLPRVVWPCPFNSSAIACHAGLAVPIFPACEALAFAADDFRRGGNVLVSRRLEHGPHDSPTLSLCSQFQAEVGGQLVGHVEPKRLFARNNYYMVAKDEHPLTDALRKAILDSGLSFQGLENETGVLRQSLMKFVRGEQ